MYFFHIYKSTNDNKWYWRFKNDGNNKIIADSGEGYDNKQDCLDGIKLVKAHSPGAGVFEKDKNGEWQQIPASLL